MSTLQKNEEEISSFFKLSETQTVINVPIGVATMSSVRDYFPLNISRSQ